MTAGRLGLKARRLAREAGDLLLAGVVALLLALVRVLPAQRAADAIGGIARRLGPRLPRSRIGRANLAHAFPDWSAAEREAVLARSWEGLGRTAVEYCHLDRIWDFDPQAGAGRRIEADAATVARFQALRESGGPAIIVAAHLGNWELPMVAAAAHGLEAAALYRAPNNRWVARWVLSQRAVAMGELIPSRRGTAMALAARLERGRILGLLVDQWFTQGVAIRFFGRTTRANPTFVRLAQRFDCPVHAVRVSRLPGDRFRLELTAALALPRGPDGRLDVPGTAQAVADLFEGWIREDPAQWLWLHRRWR